MVMVIKVMVLVTGDCCLSYLRCLKCVNAHCVLFETMWQTVNTNVLLADAG